MKPTIEQQNIIDSAKAGNNLAIKAYAGAAKTSTCIMVANEVVKNSLYISFNKDIATEAGSKFPSHVTCQTIHSLAYREIIKFPKSPMGQRLKGSLNINDILKLASFNEITAEFKEDDAFNYALIVKDTITAFCQSSSADVEKFTHQYLISEEENFINDIAEIATSYWEALTKGDSFTISHDIYLKMFQLSKPMLKNKDTGVYEVIYLDEAQDSNPVTLDIFLNQDQAQKIIVGDPFQAIYAWRGAVDAFSHVTDDFKQLTLSESFRYTQTIADQSASIINWFGGNNSITGRGEISKYNKNAASYAYLCRNNSSVLRLLLEAAEKRQYVYCNINLQELFSKLYHLAAILFNQVPKYPVAELKQYTTKAQLLKAAEKDQELATMIRLVDVLNAGKGMFQNIKDIKQYATEDKNIAVYSVTTVHKSKGLEWDMVILNDDLIPKIREDQDFSQWVDENPQEVNLLYVAVTRAKYEVIASDELTYYIGV